MLRYYTFLCWLLLGLFIVKNEIVFAASFNDRVITIAVNKTSYPYHFQNNQGEAAGLTVDLWRMWGEKQQVDVVFRLMTWSETLSQVDNGSIDIHGGLSKTRLRAKEYDFTSDFFQQKNYIYIHRDYHVREIDSLKPFTIGVVRHSSYVDFITEQYPELVLKFYDNRFDVFNAALKGEIAAFANIDRISNNYPKYRELSQLFPAYKRLLFHQGGYASAVKKGNSQLLNFIEQGMRKISREERSGIEKKWLGIDKKTNNIVLLFSPEFAPFMTVSSSGEPQGLFIDMWRLWSEYTGQIIEFVPQSFENASEMLTSGGADIHIGFPDLSFTRGNLTMYPELRTAMQVYQADIKCYVHINNKRPATSADLAGKKLGVFQIIPNVENIRLLFPENELTFYQDFKTMIQQAEKGEIDGIIGVKDIMEARLQVANVQHDFYALPDSLLGANIYAVTSKKNNRLIEIIKNGFELIPEEELIKLERRWLNKDSKGYFKLNKQRAQLSKEEDSWLSQQNKIRMGINKNWVPVEFIDENGQVQGINIDINTLVEQRTGLNFTYEVFDNWQQMLEALKQQKIDIVASATETPERRKHIIFTDSYWDMPWVIIHQKQQGERQQIEDFYGRELAIVKGYHLIEKIRKEHPTISLRLVDNHEEGLLAVQNGIVDGFAENIASASELIRRDSLVTLSMSVLEDLNIDENNYAIRKDWPILRSIINKGLATITPAEKKQIYERWFEINIETGLDKSVVLRVSLQIGAIIVIVIIAFILWNRRLYREVKIRKALEEKMKHMATHDELTDLPNRLLLKDRINHGINYHRRQDRTMAVLFIDLDGFKTINDTHGHDVGDELLILVADKLSGCVRKSDTVVRFGGDEFVLLLTGLHHKNEAAFIAEKVLKSVQQPFELSVGEVRIGCSIGIAMFPTDGESESDLLKVADTLMYRVKAAGKNHYIFNTDN
ncbi:transporter substrate-binding domain-containing protein [Thalassotalea hakodatensis]|uniref:transporter substrate-binding domain-containing protein n=1 Tax=Thalassotalea hakodatensis TaxID=3030492 RepID=UPI00257300B2|nr:transporter substrate-binding domain-containing protein [Thalassotalea hakodatensis]